MLRVAESLRFFRIFILILLSVFAVACGNEVAPPEELEIPDVSLPAPEIKPRPGFSLDNVRWIFTGEFGCDSNPTLSLLTYDPSAPLDSSSCDSGVESQGTNPSRIAELKSSLGLVAGLDTEFDANYYAEFVLVAHSGGLTAIDFANRKFVPLGNEGKKICKIIPAYEYHEAGTDSTRLLHRINSKYVYLEYLLEGDFISNCDDADVARRYDLITLNYDVDAPDQDVCKGEFGGLSEADDCKVRSIERVSESQAKGQLVRAFVGDDSASNASPHNVMTYGYLGWGSENQGVLAFRDSKLNLLWELSYPLEAFQAIIGGAKSDKYVFKITSLDSDFYLVQLGLDLFLINGSDLFSEVGDPSSIFNDRIYSLDRKKNALSQDVGRYAQVVFDDNDLVIFDNGKFFSFNYKDGYVSPDTNNVSYKVQSSLGQELEKLTSDQIFSQFEKNSCAFTADPASCDQVNDTGNSAWTLISTCEVLNGCSLPSGAFDDPLNDAVFRGAIPFSDNLYSDVHLQFFEDQLLLKVSLFERDVLVLYDFHVPLTSPKISREKLLLGGRLVQAISPPLIQGGDIYINSLVKRPGLIGNVCFKDFSEVQCNFSKQERGNSTECTAFDLAEGSCREGKYSYESRALFCSNADVTNGNCIDTNQINPQTLQVESTMQDAKWLPVISIDAVNGLQKDVRVLVSTDRQFSSNNPTSSYTKDEGVLGNPDLYKLNGVRTLSSVSEGQLQGSVESLPGALVLREGEGAVSVTAEEFLNGSAVRQQDELYVDENRDEIVRVTGSEKAQ